MSRLATPDEVLSIGRPLYPALTSDYLSLLVDGRVLIDHFHKIDNFVHILIENDLNFYVFKNIFKKYE